MRRSRDPAHGPALDVPHGRDQQLAPPLPARTRWPTVAGRELLARPAPLFCADRGATRRELAPGPGPAPLPRSPGEAPARSGEGPSERRSGSRCRAGSGMAPSALPASRSHRSDFRLDGPSRSRGNLRHDFIEDREHSQTLVLAQPAHSFAVVANRLTHDFALRLAKPFCGPAQSVHTAGVEGEGHLAGTHITTILP